MTQHSTDTQNRRKSFLVRLLIPQSKLEWVVLFLFFLPFFLYIIGFLPIFHDRGNPKVLFIPGGLPEYERQGVALLLNENTTVAYSEHFEQPLIIGFNQDRDYQIRNSENAISDGRVENQQSRSYSVFPNSNTFETSTFDLPHGCVDLYNQLFRLYHRNCIEHQLISIACIGPIIGSTNHFALFQIIDPSSNERELFCYILEPLNGKYSLRIITLDKLRELSGFNFFSEKI